jgi:hypothetical protein
MRSHLPESSLQAKTPENFNRKHDNVCPKYPEAIRLQITRFVLKLDTVGNEMLLTFPILETNPTCLPSQAWVCPCLPAQPFNFQPGEEI